MTTNLPLDAWHRETHESIAKSARHVLEHVRDGCVAGTADAVYERTLSLHSWALKRSVAQRRQLRENVLARVVSIYIDLPRVVKQVTCKRHRMARCAMHEPLYNL
jgi:hypothetical protein